MTENKEHIQCVQNFGENLNRASPTYAVSS